jgi:hypothetical protein
LKYDYPIEILKPQRIFESCELQCIFGRSEVLWGYRKPLGLDPVGKYSIGFGLCWGAHWLDCLRLSREYENKLAGFAADALTLRYTCACGMVFLIEAGKTLRNVPHDLITCPKCGDPLAQLGAALTAYQKFCEAVKLVEKGLGQKPAKLRLQVVLPDVQASDRPEKSTA